MTLVEIKALIRANLDEAMASLYTSANIVNWINAAELDIAAKSGCIESVSSLSTTINSRLVAFTGDKVNAVELVITDATAFLIPGENQWKDTSDSSWQDGSTGVWYNSTTSVSVPYPNYSDMRVTPHHLGHISKRDEILPKYWFQWGSYIVIEPLPTDTYTLNAYISGSPTAFFTTGSADSATPQIPTEFHQALVPYATCMGKIRARKYQDAAYYYGQYTMLLQELINNYIRRKPARMIDIRLPDLVKTR